MQDDENHRNRRLSKSFINQKLSKIQKEFHKKIETLSDVDWDKFDYHKISIGGHIRQFDLIVKEDTVRFVQFNTTLVNKKSPAKFGLMAKPRFSK